MIQPIAITEIMGRSDQGMTRPFICRAGLSFPPCYVKGDHAGKRSLCCEWLAGRLIQAVLPSLVLGLPAFAIADVSSELIKNSGRSDASELGAGLAFASMRIEGGQELTWSAAQGWPPEVMATLLLIDLWLQNEDRSLSERGGNPNLLVTQAPNLPAWDEEGAFWAEQSRKEMLWAYDFNLAFDERFDRTRFFSAHIFGEMVKDWPLGFRAVMEPRLTHALEHLPKYFSELPDEWLYLDGDRSLPMQLDLNRVSSVLQIPFSEPELFWTLP